MIRRLGRVDRSSLSKERRLGDGAGAVDDAMSWTSMSLGLRVAKIRLFSSLGHASSIEVSIAAVKPLSVALAFTLSERLRGACARSGTRTGPSRRPIVFGIARR